MEKSIKNFCLTLIMTVWTMTSNAAIFHSTQTGNWNSKTTWLENAIPGAGDDIHILAGHTVTKSGNSAYTHTGNIIIYYGGTLIADTGNSNDGFIFNGGYFHVFGNLTLTRSPEKDLSIEGNSFFWGHPSAIISVSDDWKVSGHSETIVDGICVDVDDDFHISGTHATVCGNGGVSIGSNSSSNTFNLQNGATTNQVCLQTTVYRGVGGQCTTIVQKGTGNDEPTAVDDQSTTFVDTPIAIDVLNLGTADSDPSGDDLKITAVGLSQLNNGETMEGGMVAINDHGTPTDPTDDFVDYTPPTGFIGTDKFTYVITDQNGAYVFAEVTVLVNAVLPVEMLHFKSVENSCQVQLEWATASEINSHYFEVQKSEDGITFETIGELNAAGFSNQYRVYDFTDELPENQNYYRLKEVSFDGAVTFSDVLFVVSDCIQAKENMGILTLFPNPAIGPEINLRFRANYTEEQLLLVSDIYGKNIRKEIITIESGMNNIPIDLSQLQAGTYVVTIGQKATQFIKYRD